MNDYESLIRQYMSNGLKEADARSIANTLQNREIKNIVEKCGLWRDGKCNLFEGREGCASNKICIAIHGEEKE